MCFQDSNGGPDAALHACSPCSLAVRCSAPSPPIPTLADIRRNSAHLVSPKHPQLNQYQGHIILARTQPRALPVYPLRATPNHCNVHTVYTSVRTHTSSHIRSTSQASQPARFRHPRGGPEDAVLAKGSAIAERPERGPGEPGHAVAGAKPAQHADHAHGGYHAAPPQRNRTITGSGCAVLRLRVVRTQGQHHVPRIL